MTEYLEPDIPEDDEPNEPEHISEEDALGLIEEKLEQEGKVEIAIPQHDLGMMREFLVRFNVEGAKEVTDEDLGDIWYRLIKDNSLSAYDSHIPGIYPVVLTDFAYLLTDFRTKLGFSTMPLPIELSDFIKHASEIETRKFSPRMWIIEKHAIPNLTALGMETREVVDSAMSDAEGLIKKAAITRFLGWLVGQEFLKDAIPGKLKEFKKKNNLENTTLTSVASVAIVGVMDKLDELESKRKVYQQGYPVEPANARRYQDVVRAMQGIQQWSITLLLDEPQSK
jgi:hypothetical protein